MIKITSDSTADLNELFEKNNISIMPLIVTLGSDSFEDGVNINGNMIFDYVSKTKILPKTAARSIQNYLDFFKQFTEKGDSVIHFNLSSEISASYTSAVAAAKLLPNVFIIDSRNLSSGTGLLVLHACDLRDSGASVSDIFNSCVARIPFVQASFVVDTMDYLHKGGRCSSIVAIAASVLKIKPMIMVSDGKMSVYKKYMGSFSKVIIKYVEETLKTFNTPDLTRIFITHTFADPTVIESVKNKILQLFKFKNVIITTAGATITSHCGKSTLGILYFNDFSSEVTK